MSDDNKKATPEKNLVLNRDGKPIPQHIIDRVQGRSKEEIAILINQNSHKPPFLNALVRDPHKDIGRNDPCPCGSGMKFKKCCLSKPAATQEPQRQHVTTMTGEIFLPIRLYYKVHSKDGVEVVFRQLDCMEYEPDGDRWTWLFDSEARNIKFKYPYSSIPVDRRPIILGSFFCRIDTEMYLDVGSIDRAVKAIEFFDRKISRSIAEVEFFAIYNKITTTEAEHPGPCFDQLFADVQTDQIDNKMEEHIAKMGDAVKAGTLLDIINDRKFDLVDAHRVNYYEDGLDQFTMSLEMREAVAVARWSGQPDYCMNDLIKDTVFRRKS